MVITEIIIQYKDDNFQLGNDYLFERVSDDKEQQDKNQIERQGAHALRDRGGYAWPA
jgi:hypothetical protein